MHTALTRRSLSARPDAAQLVRQRGGHRRAAAAPVHFSREKDGARGGTRSTVDFGLLARLMTEKMHEQVVDGLEYSSALHDDPNERAR
jgi:hypothetical protein